MVIYSFCKEPKTNNLSRKINICISVLYHLPNETYNFKITAIQRKMT